MDDNEASRDAYATRMRKRPTGTLVQPVLAAFAREDAEDVASNVVTGKSEHVVTGKSEHKRQRSTSKNFTSRSAPHYEFFQL